MALVAQMRSEVLKIRMTEGEKKRFYEAFYTWKANGNPEGTLAEFVMERISPLEEWR